MFAKQLSVFIENRQGRLGEVLDVLKKNDVNILSLSLADTTEYGLLRLIVNNSLIGKAKLAESSFSTMLTDVLVVKLKNEAGSLQKLLAILSSKNINIEYMYGLSTNEKFALIVVKPSDLALAEKVLNENGVETITENEV